MNSSWCFEDHVTFIFDGNWSMKNARCNGGVCVCVCVCVENYIMRSSMICTLH